MSTSEVDFKEGEKKESELDEGEYILLGKRLDDISIAEQQSEKQTSQDVSYVLKGRPYPEEYDNVSYPLGFVAPSFRLFDGIGNPRQHLAHFKASCCNIEGIDALMCRQFFSSLSSLAFDWYNNIPNGSFRTFAELENLFLNKFNDSTSETGRVAGEEGGSRRWSRRGGGESPGRKGVAGEECGS